MIECEIKESFDRTQFDISIRKLGKNKNNLDSNVHRIEYSMNK